MPANYCIPKSLADKLLQAAKEGDVIGKLEQLDVLSSKERREAFAKHVGPEAAQQINTSFEQAMISTRKNALENWAKATFSPEAKKNGQYKDALDKINELDREGLLTPEKADQFLEDLVKQRLGISITPTEAAKISELSKNIEETSKLPGTQYGPPIEFFKAKRELENYTDSLTPTSRLKVATSVIGRATMLASIKSPLVNIESNAVNAISEGFARRIESMGKAGVLPRTKSGRGYMNYVNKVYAQTGYDLSRMMTFSDGKKRLGEDIIHSQGKGAIRAIGRAYTDIVFNKLMTAPDVAFAAGHFTDSATIHATVIAKSEGLKGKALRDRVDQLFLDATKVEPKTLEGQQIRDKARLEAERGTYTDKNNYSKTALMLRRTLNTASSDLRIGDQLTPFVQVPATVVGRSLDYSGVLLPLETLSAVTRAVNAKKAGNPDAFKEVFNSDYIRKVLRAGIGTTTAFILSNLFNPDDFIGEYPTTEKERELFKLEKATTNSIRIGNKWISLDYFGPLAAPFVGIMSAKKYANSPIESFLQYAGGTLIQASRIPGFRQFYESYNALSDLNPAKNDPEALKSNALLATVDFIRSRTLPALVSDIAKGTDKFEREVDKYDVIGKVIQNIPVLRENLPEKLNIFGENVSGEGFFGSVLFGSRVKTREDSKLINEFSRLAQEDLLPSITDVRKTSSRAKELKTQIGDKKFREFYSNFGQRFKYYTLQAMDRPSYQQGNDEDKKKIIEDVKSKQFDIMLKRYGYKSKTKKKSSDGSSVFQTKF